jgi:dipeptidase
MTAACRRQAGSNRERFIMRRTILTWLLIGSSVTPRVAGACTNILVTPGASTDGSTLITYSADSHTFYGELVLIPPGVFGPEATREIIEWDTGKFLGRIPQAPRTYSVVGNINEKQVAIGETTFGGRDSLKGPAGILDYGSLMFIALERAGTAREAIRVITGLVAEYGYASTGESISISDPREAWILEIIGKGAAAKGAVWVARRVPDGYISAHANHPRIRQFPLNDPANCLYAPDVISFARGKGWFSGRDEEFSFCDTYAPLTASKLRSCEARVWSVFRRAAPSLGLTPDYVDGSTLQKRMPLWIKADRKLSVQDAAALMRDHYEGTPFDMTRDLGGGPFASPYRWRPMAWEVDSVKYLHERAISTQQTGFSFVAQSRAGLPDPIGGVLWFGVDDTYTTVYVPFYCGITRAPKSWAAGAADFGSFSRESAFWVFNFVANWAYSRYSDMIVDIQDVQRELEGRFLADQPGIDQAALKLYLQAPQLARDYLTDYCEREGEMATERWRKLGDFLIWKYLDGNVRDAQAKVTHPKYPESWYRAIVRDAGERVKVLTPDAGPKPAPATAR